MAETLLIKPALVKGALVRVLLIEALLIEAPLAEAGLIEPAVAEALATLATDGALTKTLIEASRVAALVAEPAVAETLIARFPISKSRIVLPAEALVTEPLGTLASVLTPSHSPSRAAEATHRRKRVERSGAAVGSAAETADGGKWIHTRTRGGTPLSATGDSASRTRG